MSDFTFETQRRTFTSYGEHIKINNPRWSTFINLTRWLKVPGRASAILPWEPDDFFPKSERTLRA